MNQRTEGDDLWRIVKDELFSRAGLDGAWDSIDADTKAEIEETLVDRFNQYILMGE
jgi:hypothetical protein